MEYLSKYKSLAEVCTGGDFNESTLVMRELDDYLRLGWEVIAVHERGWKHDSVSFTTVYILGHVEANAPHGVRPNRYRG